MGKLQFTCSVFLILLTRLAPAQVPTAHDGELALGFAHSRAGQTSTWFVDYVEHAGEPAFRISVHHFHADCAGYLYIGKTKIAYTPAFTPGQKDAFQVARRDLNGASPRYSGFSFTVAGKAQQFAFLSEPANRAASAPDSREQLMLFVSLMMSDFDLAQGEFGRIVAGWQQAFSPSGAPNQPPGVAAIRVFSPRGAAEGKQVDSTRDSLAVLGVVAQPTPVRGVLMNGQPIPTRQISLNIVEFQSAPVPLQSAATAVNLLSICDSGQSQLMFTVRKPTITFATTPLRTPDATADVKGTLTGYGEIERVELDGKAATLTRNTDNSVGFEAPGIPVELGKNTLLGTIASADGARHSFSVVVERRPRLTLDFVRRAIPTLSRTRLLELLDEYGVDFQLDEGTTKQLRAAGADQSVLEAIGEAAH
jgi:hypothetical protein